MSPIPPYPPPETTNPLHPSGPTRQCRKALNQCTERTNVAAWSNGQIIFLAAYCVRVGQLKVPYTGSERPSQTQSFNTLPIEITTRRLGPSNPHLNLSPSLHPLAWSRSIHHTTLQSAPHQPHCTARLIPASSAATKSNSAPEFSTRWPNNQSPSSGWRDRRRDAADLLGQWVFRCAGRGRRPTGDSGAPRPCGRKLGKETARHAIFS
ncbi:hypothetical protein EX30DRAFT_349639 [Ascodesmis nigricans]|uniref:Uncharacterized protein n=1 Tax=Ascodesmis nigricans TaxID=341454 RepID=A0A4S2MUD4_9PEZI|nr:hypothetical protein EX30DRAFT_349639 [Ascodesmis nigricans]